MPNRIVCRAGLTLLLAAAGVFGYVERPFTLTFVPPLSTNGREYASVSSNFALGIIGDRIGEIRGAQVSSVFSIIQDQLFGAQAAGVCNMAGGGVDGAQAAGVFNMAGGVDGVQAAGVFNMAGGVDGVQAAGVGNICGEVLGVQAGVVNVAELFGGLQVGVANIAGNGNGVQVGVVNVCGQLEGSAIGLVSIIGNGMFHVATWASDAPFFNVGLKTGSRHIYNVFAAGYHPLDPSRTAYGWGIGGHIDEDPFFVDIDGIAWNMSKRDAPFKYGDLNLLNKLRVTGGFRVTSDLAVSLGPTVNVWVSENGEPLDGMFDFTLYDNESSGTRVAIWPGFTAGLQFF